MDNPTVQFVVEASKRVPKPSAAELAIEYGVTRQRIYQVAAKAGVKLADGRARRREVPRQWATHFGVAAAIPPQFTGAAGETTAAAWLLRRGIPVYRSMAPVGSCHLVAPVGDRLLRVEVRCAKRNGSGVLQYARPTSDRYDVLSLVEPDGSVTWIANQGIEWEP